MKGEVFESSKAYLACLQGFVLSRGFAVVTISSTARRFRFGCIHHGNESKNWRKLEEHVQKDPENKKTVSKRQREDTSKKARACYWEMYWSVRSLGKRGSGQSARQLGITQDTHSYILALNPFIYKVYQKVTLQYQQAIDLALRHYLAY